MINIEELEWLVDIVLGDPPTDNADILAGATALERDADEIEAACPTGAKAARAQAQRLRDFVASRTARAGAASGPPLH